MGEIAVVGLVEGTLVAILAVAITLTYRGTGTVNFALGEVGTLGLYVAWWLSIEKGLPWAVGAAGALAVGTGVGVVFERLVVRPMHVANPVTISVATVGLLSFLLALEYQVFGASPRAVAVPLNGFGVRVAGVVVTPTQLLSVGVVIAVAVGLALFLRHTDFGLGVLATAQDPEAARLMGVPVARATTFVWGASGAAAALAALFMAPTIGVVSPGIASTHLYAVALAAAVVGGLSSLPAAFIGGLLVGVSKAAVLRAFAGSDLPGKEYLVYLAIVLAVLLVRPDGIGGAWRNGGRRLAAE